jgi:hypothetical protein
VSIAAIYAAGIPPTRCRFDMRLGRASGEFGPDSRRKFSVVTLQEENVMVRRGLSVCVTVATILLVASTVQQAHAQGRRGGGGMMGMGGGQGVNPLGLVGNAAVQKDLGVSEDKAEKLKDIAGDVRQDVQEEFQSAGIDFGALRDLSGEEREKKMAEIRTKMAEIQKTVGDKFMPKIAEILDKTQMTRLHEIAVQAAGPSALKDAGVVKDLGLSKEQQDKIAAIDKDFSGKLTNVPRAERFAKMQEMRDEQLAKTTEVLSKDQQAKFTEMKGKAFDLKSLRPARGNRRTRKSEDK